jgi:Na+/proline symporter
MELTTIDWLIVAAFFALSLGIGLGVSRKSGQDFSSFFLAGRNMPWWLLGISIVATTFSTDTPNLVADITRSNGVVGNWVWWAFLLTGMVTVFLYAKLWRRSGVMTDVEFYELRYSGPLAAFLRGFRAAYLGILFNVVIMASVTLAAIKIGSVMMGWAPLQTVVVAASVTMLYSVAGGLRGVVLTDMIQFTLAIAGSIAAAIYVVNLPEVGGLSALLDHPNVRDKAAFLPDFSTMTWQDLIPIFVIPLAVQWWATYYPGSEPGGGGYVVQRMLATRSERDAATATFAFNVMHYALRPWPWILVALASLVVFPDLASIGDRFPHVPDSKLGHDLAYPAMLTFLPPGLLGLVFTGLAAAYMSTISTQVNWGASVVVNDIYQRFYKPDASQRELVLVGRMFTALLLVLACVLALAMENALQAFNIILQIGAGTGLLYILRWFWWRVNAAAELTAMVVSFVIAILFATRGGLGLESWEQLVVGVGVTTVAWVSVALLGRPTDSATLFSFLNRVRPGGPGWKKIRETAAREGVALGDADGDFPAALLATVLGCIAIYAAMFATGFLIYGQAGAGLGMIAVALIAGLALWSQVRKLSFR